MMPEWLQKLREQRKIKEQEELIKALKNEPKRRPAAKFANKIGSK